MRHSTVNGIEIAEVPVKEFKVILYDGKKKSMGKNRCNAGFFGKYGSSEYTLPSGHAVCDYAATSPETLASCKERGRFAGNKFSFDSGKWTYKNEFYGNAVSTLVVNDGRAQVKDLETLPASCDYAIAGYPIMRDGQDVKFDPYVIGQGWGGGSLYGTWHIFVGIKEKNASKVYVMAMKTKTTNMIRRAEAYKKFKPLGFYDVIKLDGGGSFYYNINGKAKSTAENRRVCTIIDMGELETGGNPYKVPTRSLRKGTKGDDVKWLQWELNDHGYTCAIDGRFGGDTDRKLRAYQKDAGLAVDGSCGAATRASLKA